MSRRGWVTRYWIKGPAGTVSENPRWQVREFSHNKKEAGWKRVSKRKFREIFGDTTEPDSREYLEDVCCGTCALRRQGCEYHNGDTLDYESPCGAENWRPIMRSHEKE